MKRTNITYLIVLALGAAILFAALFISPQSKKFEIASFPERNNYTDNNHPEQANPDINCGPISLKMILDYYDIPSTLKEIEEKIELKGKGASMLSLKQFSESKGLHADGWRLTLRDLLKTRFPVILFVNRNHYVVADSVFRDTIFLRDPTLGKFLLPTSNLTGIWKGETLIFSRKN